MAVKVMQRTASDNKYLHRDFHVSCDIGIAYVGKRYGEEGVQQYLNQYVDNYLSPVAQAVRQEGFAPLVRYLEELYEVEEASDQLRITEDGNQLKVQILACPAMAYMKSTGHQPSPWYAQTVSTLYKRLAENAGLHFHLDSYQHDTGAARFRFEKEAQP